MLSWEKSFLLQEKVIAKAKQKIASGEDCVNAYAWKFPVWQGY